MLGKDTRVEMHKSIFGNKKNDPRLIGVSSQVNENITTINKVFLPPVLKTIVVHLGQ